MNIIGDIASLAATIRQSVDAKGWAWIPTFQPHDDGGRRLVELANALGSVCSMGKTGSPLIETSCESDAPAWEPFNRREAIGWHNDFSTWEKRPVLSLAWVRSVPANSESRGDWRVVSCSEVISILEESSAGRRSLSFFRQKALPFVFAPDEHPVHFLVLDGVANSRARFYGRALRLGLANEPDMEAINAIEEWERAADSIGHRLPAVMGALLVCNNWRSMHDRLEQSPGRSSCLIFIADNDDVKNYLTRQLPPPSQY